MGSRKGYPGQLREILLRVGWSFVREGRKMLSNVRERGRTTRALNRRVGLEQEFFLVEESGMPADRADEFLLCCREMTEREGGSPVCFAPEFVMGLVEINTPPVYTLAELEREYLRRFPDREVDPERLRD